MEKYKNRPMAVVETATLVAIFLPEDGAKMASLRVKESGEELLVVRNKEDYKVLEYDGDYAAAECSGFDDMFPTIDSFQLKDGPYQGITYPDHGEACRLPYTMQRDGEKLIFLAQSKIFPLEYRKEVWPAQDGKLRIRYIYRNKGNQEFPFLWAAHMMLRGVDGARMFTSYPKSVVPELMFATEGFAKEELPIDHLSGYKPGEGAVYKYYYMESMPEGVFGITYPDGHKLVMEIDAEKIPYYGVWINNGKFQDLYTITPEPCSVPLDAVDRAAERGYKSTIPGEGIFEFEMSISWEV